MSSLTIVKPPPVINRSAAPIQITAAQLLADARIHQQYDIRPPLQRIMDQDQLQAYKQVKRRQFEDRARRQSHHIGMWIRYAKWKARSIYQRALEVDYTNKSIWLKYAQFEMRHKFVIHARNVWQRAIHYLPRQDQFWYKYTYMQQLLGEYQKARQIFQRWMEWQPGLKGWDSYIKFEQRLGQRQRATVLVHRYMKDCPSIKSYLKTAQYQIKNRNRILARSIFQRVLPQLGLNKVNQQFYIEFAKFQLRNKEFQRARVIMKHGLDHLSRQNSRNLYDHYLNFQKQHGSTIDINTAIIEQRRQYYNISQKQGTDKYISLAQLQSSSGNIDKARQAYQTGLQKGKPPIIQKRYWRRYIYLYYFYALFQQNVAKNIDNATSVYQRAIKAIPHQQFSFSQLWLLFALHLIRKGELQRARKIFGMGIGKAPKPKLFRSYIQVEQQLCNIGRVRKIYQKYIQTFPRLDSAWKQFIKFEQGLEQNERVMYLKECSKRFGIIIQQDQE